MKTPKFFTTLLALLLPLFLLAPRYNTHALCFSTDGATSSSVDYTGDRSIANLKEQSDIVALGILTFVNEDPWPPTYTLNVEKRWKGDAKKGDTLTIRDGKLGGGPCGGGLRAKSGQRYLLFLSGTKDHVLSVNSYRLASLDTKLPLPLQSVLWQALGLLHVSQLGEEWALVGSGFSLMLALALLLVWFRLKPKKL